MDGAVPRRLHWPLDTMSHAEPALIEGFLHGDPVCTDQIDTWIAEVLRHPRLRLGDDRGDVAQQVRRKLIVSLRSGSFQGTASLRTYVWRAAQHVAIDHLRARRRRPAIALEDVAEPTDAAPTPERALLQRERRDILMRILERLGEDCRTLLHLIVFDELSYKEIAAQLQATEGAIKVRALRCREKAAAEFKSVTSGTAGRPLPEDRL